MRKFKENYKGEKMIFSKFNVIINDVENNRILLNNSLSGETFAISSELKDIIEREKDEELLPTDIKETFVKSGVLVEDNNLELQTIEYFHNKEKFLNDTLSITLLLTMNCNLRCVYCYEGAGIVSNKSLSAKEYSSVLQFIKSQIDFRDCKKLSICLFGGEPTLELKNSVDFLREAKQYCAENKLEFSTTIITNGTLINEERIKILLNNNCSYIQITLDGTQDFHDKRRITSNGKGSFCDTVEGIKLLINSELPNPVIRINLDKTNYDNVFELLREMQRINLNVCPIDFGIVKGNTPSCDNYKSNCFEESELGDLLAKLWNLCGELGFEVYTAPSRKYMYCGMYSDSAFTITPDLSVYKCWDLVNQEEHRVGRIDRDGNFIETTQSYFNWMNRTPLSIDECRSCKYLPVCGGGCAAMAVIKNNLYNSPGCYKIKSVYEQEVLLKFKKEGNKSVK